MADVRGSVTRTVLATLAWGGLHSLLASRTSKRVAVHLLGQGRYAGLYRLGYNGVAVVSAIGWVVYVHRLPDRTLYRVRGPGRVPLALLRLALIGVAVRAALEVGVGPFSGLPEAWAWLGQRQTFEAPEAQGPALTESSRGPELKTGGPFRYVRHPLNGAAAAIFFLPRTMTAVRLTVALLAAGYAVVGSKLEERRLLARYGTAYEPYLRSGVPFLVPRLPLRRWIGESRWLTPE